MATAKNKPAAEETEQNGNGNKNEKFVKQAKSYVDRAERQLRLLGNLARLEPTKTQIDHIEKYLHEQVNRAVSRLRTAPQKEESGFQLQ